MVHQPVGPKSLRSLSPLALVTDTVSRRELKASQRERICEGMVDAAVRQGYANVTVSAVIERAGVSRPTFYEHFRDREACLLAVQRELAAQLLAQLTELTAQQPPERLLALLAQALLELSEQRPQVALFLMGEAMGAGEAALDQRDRLVAQIAALAGVGQQGAGAQASVPDVPGPVIVGALFRLIARMLRQGHWQLIREADGLIAWIDSYTRALKDHLYGELWLSPAHVVAADPGLELHPPPRLPPGRPWLSPAEIASNQRGRILFAAAELSQRRGWAAISVEEIARSAGVARKAFYAQFADKQAAGLALHELFFERVLSVSASAFFSSSGWSERVWAGVLGTARFFAVNPIVAHFGCVESQALGRTVLERVDESIAAFTIFLREGEPEAAGQPSEVALQAIACANLEILYLQTRAGAAREAARVAHCAAYTALAPFMGAARASEFLARKLEIATDSRQPIRRS